MREVRAAIALALWVWCGSADGALWVGQSSLAGPVEPPSEYAEAVAPLILQRFDFNDLPEGADRNGHDLGGFVLLTGLPDEHVIAQADTVAGALPASPTGTGLLWCRFVLSQMDTAPGAQAG